MQCSRHCAKCFMRSILHTTLQGRNFCFIHFRDEKTKAQKGKGTLPKSIASKWQGLNSNLSSLASGSIHFPPLYATSPGDGK